MFWAPSLTVADDSSLLPTRRLARARSGIVGAVVAAEAAEEPEVDVKDRVRRAVEEMLANRLDRMQCRPVEFGCRSSSSALRRGDGECRVGKGLLVFTCKPVEDVPFGHRSAYGRDLAALARGRGVVEPTQDGNQLFRRGAVGGVGGEVQECDLAVLVDDDVGAEL